jgi:SSS family transporter
MFLAILLVVVSAVVLQAEESKAPQEYYKLSEDASAAFEGSAIGRSYAVVGKYLFAIGGKTADGTFMSDVQVLERTGDSFKLHRAELSEPIAFSGTVGHGGKAYVVGGLNAKGVSDRVLSLTWDGSKLSETVLPPLPAPRLMSGVTHHRTTTKDYLYVLGGVSSLQGNAASSDVYELRLADIDSGKARWVNKGEMPFGGRIGAIVRETYNEIVVSGGWDVKEDGTLNISSDVWGYARVARDGHTESGWEQRADMPVPVAMGAFSKTGQGHITSVGGDTAGGNLTDLLAGTKEITPVDGVWAFHDPTDTWVLIGTLPKAVSGGLFAEITGDEYVLVDSVEADGSPATGEMFNFTRSTKPMKFLDYMVIVIYFLVVAGVGTYFARKQTSSEEFALGNRKVKWWAAGISMFASGVSTISFMALPALIACIGLASTGPAIFMIFGVFVGAYVTYPMLRRLNITSTFEYLEHRYGLSLRLAGSFIGIVTQMMGRIGIVVMLPALAISSMTGLDPWKAILLTGVVTTIYSTAGGFEAVIWTDVTQGIMMTLGFIAMAVLAFMNIKGGLPAFMEYGQELHRFHFFITKFDVRINMMWFAIAGNFIAIMAFAGDQATAQRVLSTPMRDVRKLAFLGGAFSIGSALIVGVCGIGLFACFKSQPELLNPVMKNDQLVPLFVLSKVPMGMAGLLIATMFAAAMSTVSTSVNSCAVQFGEDFYKRFKKSTSSKEEMRVMQVVSVITGTIGTGLALWLLSMPLPTLWESFVRIMALIGGGFVGVYSLGMFTRRTHELGAIFGVVVSFFVAFYIQYLPWDIHYGGLSLIIVSSCMISGYLFSIIVPWKRKPLRGLTVWDQITNEEAEERIRAAGLEEDVKG